MLASISGSLGLGLEASKLTADIICPDWQNPHWGTSIASHALVIDLACSELTPSIVVISAPYKKEDLEGILKIIKTLL